MFDVNPAALKVGDWFRWHDLEPPLYLVLQPLNENGVIIADMGENIRIHGAGNFTPAAVSVANRRFERMPPPQWARRPLPEDEGAMVLASTVDGGKVLATLTHEGSYGMKWVESGSGEWVDPGHITDWRLIDGLDTVRPGQEAPASIEPDDDIEPAPDWTL